MIDFRREYHLGWREALSLDAAEWSVLVLGLSAESATAAAAATVGPDTPPAQRSLEDLRRVMARHRGDFEDLRGQSG